MRSARLGLLLFIAFLASLLAVPRRASADHVDDSILRLRRSRAYKVRVSAALFLAQQREPRAIMALARAIEHDRDTMVRRVAALSLTRAIDDATDVTVRRAVIEVLARVARRDRDSHVRRSAELALGRIRRGLAARLAARTDDERDDLDDVMRDDSALSASRIFVHFGRPSDQSRALPSGSGDALLEAVRGALRLHAPDYQMASGVLPTRAELASRGLRGFTIHANVASVGVEPNGNYTDVTCTVSVRVGPWSGRDGNETLSAHVSASATGNGHVTASRRGARRAAVDCAVTVVEELAARQVIPFLRQLAATPP